MESLSIKISSSLVESLAHILSTGLYSDAAFIVGPEKFRMDVHKSIVSARSEPLATMLQERWNQDNQKMEIALPHFNTSPFKHFVKYLYTDHIPFKGMTIDEILEVTHTAHLYQVPKLFAECITHLRNSINATNCVQIFKNCKTLDEKLSDEAFAFFSKNLVPAAQSNDAYLSWDADMIERILLDEQQHVPELTLFKALLKWNGLDSSRNSSFEKLLGLIRFPTMEMSVFASEVVPRKILSDKETLDLYAYIATQKGSVKFNTKPRKEHSDIVNLWTKEVAVPMQTWVQEIISHAQNMFRISVGESELDKNAPAQRNLFVTGVRFYNLGWIAHMYLEQTYLQQQNATIIVSVIAPHGAVIGSINCSFTELSESNFEACFDSPLTLEFMRTYTFQVRINQTNSINSLLGMSRVPSTVTGKLGHMSNNSGFGRRDRIISINDSKINVEGVSGRYSFIQALILSPENRGVNDCVIS